MLWKAFGIVMACANCVLIAFLFYYLHLNRHTILAPANGLEWKDFVSILLTALGVMLAVMTLFLAVLAIWGFNSLKEEAIRVARTAAMETAGPVAAQAAGSYLQQTVPQPASPDHSDYGQAAARESSSE